MVWLADAGPRSGHPEDLPTDRELLIAILTDVAAIGHNMTVLLEKMDKLAAGSVKLINAVQQMLTGFERTYAELKQALAKDED